MTPDISDKVANHFLGQRDAAWAHEQTRSRIGRFKRGVEAGGKNVGAQHHAGAATCRRIVDGAMTANPMFADVFRLKRPKALFERRSRHGAAERSGEHFRIKRENGRGPHCQTFDAASSSAGGRITTRPPATSTSGTTARVKGNSRVSPTCWGNFQNISGAVIGGRRRPPQARRLAAFRRAGRSGRGNKIHPPRRRGVFSRVR